MDNVLFVPSKTSLCHCWGCGDRLIVYSRPKDSKGVPQSEASIHEVRWGVSMTSNEFLRRLAKTSYDVFSGVVNNTNPEKLISFSVQYRAALAACSQEILQFLRLNEQLDEPKAMHLAAECELVQSLELIWHLAELIFIQAFPSGHLAYSLCSWFYIQSQEAADNARVLIEEYSSKSHSRPEQDERFWPTILTLVLQARSHEAAGLLSIHSHANSRILRSLRQILVSLPIASQARTKGMWGKSGAVFSSAWSYWQSECTRLFTSGEFAPVGGDDTETADHVQLIASVLCGHAASWDDPRLIEATGGPNTWYFRFVSFLFYTDQMVTIDGIGYHLDQWFLRPTNSTLSDNKTPLDQAIDELIISVFRLNLQQFIHTAGEKLSSRWLVAHFTHLLHRVYPDMLYSSENPENNQMGTGRSHTKLEDTDPDIGHHGTGSSNSPIRSTFPLADSFLIGYAESLASDPSMLYLALGYMDHCDSGRARQSALLLAHGVPTSTRAVNWMISQAKIRGLHSTGNQLARMAARRFMPLAVTPPTATDEHSTPAEIPCLPACGALGWALLARDNQIVHRLAEQTLLRDSGFTQNGQMNAQLFTVPTEVAEMAAIILGFCKDRAIQTEDCAESDQRSVVIHSDLSPMIALSPELAFLVRYAELQQCFIDGNVEGAVDRLIDLLVTGSGGPGSVPMIGSNSSDNGGSCAKVSTRLRLRLLSEVNHLLGKQCVRRDQVELLLSALTELRLELSADETHEAVEKHTDLSNLLAQFHVALVRELASTFLRPSITTELPPLMDVDAIF